MFKCDICGKEFESKQKLGGHISGHKRKGVKRKKYNIKENKKFYTCKFCGEDFKFGIIGAHTKWCEKNPDKEKYIKDLEITRMYITDDVISNRNKKIKLAWENGKYDNINYNYCFGRTLSEDTKLKISKSLKKAHKENRHSGWEFINSDPELMSYPEKYIKKCLESYNLFSVYNIEIHKQVSKYTLDFAIINLKIDLEVDGQQHYLTTESINHDNIRNDFLIKNGWKIYRIVWKDFIKNPYVNFKKFLDYLESDNKPHLTYAPVSPLATNQTKG